MMHRMFLPRYELGEWLPLLQIVFVSMMLILISAHIGTVVIAPSIGWGHGIEALSQQTTPPHAFEGQLARWDSGYYLGIAEIGYRPDGPERAFFPFYPLLCRVISSGLGISILWSGWLVSLPCFLAAPLYLYRLVREDYNAHAAKLGMLVFCFFPVAFYNLAFYPEALYLLCSIACIYYARRGRFLVSGFCIAIAGATRPSAFLLAIPFVLEFVVQRQYSSSRWLSFASGTLLAPLGTFGYFGFLSWQLSGANPIAIYNSNLEHIGT
jgi:Gpi18-like mannosyltransferase